MTTHWSHLDMTGPSATALSAAGDATDRELLARFVSEREESAFAALVQRHGAVVLQVCRQKLGCEQDAEDVFQATFLALARQAAVVDWMDSVGPWLQTVARRLSVRARCSAQRLRSQGARALESIEHEPADPRPDPPTEADRRELTAVIDEELRRLPEEYRAPVVLCYLQGKTNEQAASELGWPTGSMSRRLARGRALLRARLSRRGLALAILALLTLVGLWLWGSASSPRSGSSVVAAMASLRPNDDCPEGFEQALLLAAEGPQVTGEERARLTRMARRAVAASEELPEHAPGQRRRDWQRLSAQMHQSALALSESLAQNDTQTTRQTARRLALTCQSCHATFRD